MVDTAEGSSAVIPGSTRFERPATPGSDLQLTLDSDLQYTVQRQLAEYAAAKGAKGGSAVVLDAKTGEVLAMANARTFDPRAFASADESTLGNAAVSSPYEPGSVNKVVTMAAALEYHTAAPDRVFAVPGSIRVADRTVSDAWNHGTEDYTLTGILAKSSNVGTIMAAREVGEDRFADMLARFGLGKRTGVGLPGESPGPGAGARDLVGLDVRQPADRAGPVGDGAADGRDVPGGRQRRRAHPAADRRGARSGRTASAPRRPRPRRCGSCRRRPRATLRTMLTAVTQDGRTADSRGTGHAAAIPGYQVAGKTGTAQQVDPSCGCYASSTYWITFAGMLPAQDPRYVVAIMLDAPQGGTSAAPLFHDIGSYLAQREKLPVSPDPQPVQTLVSHAPPAAPAAPGVRRPARGPGARRRRGPRRRFAPGPPVPAAGAPERRSTRLTRVPGA